nr:hypothetical protein [Nocardioides zhouii]
MHDQRDACFTGCLGDDERAVEADAALLVAVAAERVDGRHEDVGARHDLGREGRVAEVTDVLLDPAQLRRGPGAAYDRAHGRAPRAERGHGVAAHESVGSGHDDDGCSHASTLSGRGTTTYATTATHSGAKTRLVNTSVGWWAPS